MWLADISAWNIKTVGALQPRAHGKICIDRARPCDCGTRLGVDWSGNFSIVRDGVKILDGELLACRHIVLHFLTTARVQMMTRLEQIEGGTHKRINSVCGETPKSVPVNRSATSKAFEVTGSWDGKRCGHSTTLHALSRRVRQVVRCQAKYLLQVRVEIFECRRQFGFDPLARL